MSGDVPVVAAYKGPAGPDVLAFASAWAAAADRPLEVVTVYPGPFPVGMGRTDAEWVSHNRAEAEKHLNEAREQLPGSSARFRAIAADSASHGLHDVLERAGRTALAVVGSKKSTGVRRTSTGSTVNRLLQGAPAPVALVPWDYEALGRTTIERITVAYVATADGNAALRGATAMAVELGATLHVVTVLPDTRVSPSLGEPHAFASGQREAYQEALDSAVATVDGPTVTTGVLDGPVIDALADLRPDDTDVLVCGSRGYGPALRVLVGGVSSRLLRQARVPVVVVPRGAK